jgi:hypothetical protein
MNLEDWSLKLYLHLYLAKLRTELANYEREKIDLEYLPMDISKAQKILSWMFHG